MFLILPHEKPESKMPGSLLMTPENGSQMRSYSILSDANSGPGLARLGEVVSVASMMAGCVRLEY